MMIPFKYSVVDTNAGAAFKIESGEFSGVAVTLGGISFNEDTNNRGCTMSFDYEVVGTPVHEDRRDVFESQLGDLIVHILEESAKIGKLSEFIGDE